MYLYNYIYIFDGVCHFVNIFIFIYKKHQPGIFRYNKTVSINVFKFVIYKHIEMIYIYIYISLRKAACMLKSLMSLPCMASSPFLLSLFLSFYFSCYYFFLYIYICLMECVCVFFLFFLIYRATASMFWWTEFIVLSEVLTNWLFL